MRFEFSPRVATHNRFLIALVLFFTGVFTSPAAVAEIEAEKIGVVLMHGKGGFPQRYISDLASPLERKGFWVANLEMPWSGRRNYNADVATAEREIESAMSALREKGARKIFVAGFSQGGLFTLYFGGKQVTDGIIAIAPGGNVNNANFREKLGEYVESARQLVAEGKGDEPASLMDYESSKGTYPVIVRPSIYLTWFDPDGAMNQNRAVRNIIPAVPVLFIVPKNDYPTLLRVKQEMFDALPKNPRTKLYEPNATHLGAPAASVDEVIDWITAVANAP